MACNEDAVRLLAEKLIEVEEDPDVTGVIVIVERTTRIHTTASATNDLARRLGLIEMAKADILARMMEASAFEDDPCG